ncbi:MAG TPA: hypothetical protein VKE93_21700 [Candidatus Angelobacter sp.]|nr:hypothetical protein [Candidatus Angelobacter sp.]
MANLVLAGIALQLPLAASVLGKRLWRSFPIFATYSLSNLIVTLGLYALRRGVHVPLVNFYAYWICEGLSVLLGFGVVYELFRELFRPYDGLRRMAAAAFKWVLAGLVALACVVLYAQSSGEQNPLMSAVLVTEETARIVEVGLLVFLFAFSRAFGLHWRQNVFGIALGLGVFTSVELAGIALQTHIGPAAFQAFNLARALSFNASLLIWMVYILAPERITSTAELPQRAQLEQWNQAIMELIHQ